MSIVRNRKLKKVGITGKSKKRQARKYINYMKTFVKCNRDYAYKNIACNMGLLPEFWKYGSVIE